MTEKKLFRLTAGKRRVPPMPKEPHLVIKKGKPSPVGQERLPDHRTPGSGEKIETPELSPSYRAATKEPEAAPQTEPQHERSPQLDFPLSYAPGDVVIGTDDPSGEPVILPYQARDLGVTVLGQTGYGKTTLLEQLILHDIAQGTAVIVIDAHGDLTKRILSLADADEANLLLEAWEDAPFRLHLFDCADPTSPIAVDRTVSGIVQVFKKLFGSPREFYPRLERDLGNAARTVIANRGTLLDVPRLFWDADFRAAALARVTNRQVREFWARWERLGRADRQLDQLEATINRLDQFLASEFVTAVVGSTTTTLPLDEVLSGTGQALLVNLPVGEIGEGLTNLLGALVLAVLTERIFARARLDPADRPRVHLYLDEYGRYATPTTAQLLTEGRKFGVGTTIAHQTRAQILDEENRAAELQVGGLVCFQLIGADAAELAGEFHISPEPQWEEPVEEIEGEEPELAVPPNPVEQLIKSGHPDPVIREAVRGFLAPLFQRRDELEGKTRGSSLLRPKVSVAERPPYELISPSSEELQRWGNDYCNRTTYYRLKQTCEILEKALADAMEQRIEDTPDVVFRALCTHWSMIVSFSELPDLKMSLPGKAEVVKKTKKVRERRYGILRPGEDSYVTTYVPVEEQETPERVQLKTHTLNSVQGFIKSVDAIVGTGGNPADGPHEQHLAEELLKVNCHWSSDQQNRTIIISRISREIGEFVCPLLILLHRLKQEPLLVPTGRHRPRKRLRYITHPQRSYQDVQNELAVQLASLPRFTVYTSVQGDQHRVSLSPPAEGDIDEERIEQIRQVSRTRFGRPVQPSPPETPSAGSGPPPPISRYHADESEP